MDTNVNHPHFDKIEAATECYRSKATGMCYVIKQQGDDVYALAAMTDGTLPPVHQEPYVIATDVWDVLDAIHARR